MSATGLILMTMQNGIPQFSHPMRELGIIAVFLVVAMPVQVCIEAFMQHSWNWWTLASD